MSRHQFWYLSAILLLSYPTLSTAFPPTVTDAVPGLYHEHHAVTLDDHVFEALELIELGRTAPGTLITEQEPPNSQKPNLHEAGRNDMSGIYEYFDGPIDFDCVLHFRHGDHPWTLASSSQPPGPSPEQTQWTVIESRPSPLSPMFTQGWFGVQKGGIEALNTHSSTLLERPGQHDQPEKDVNMPGSRKRSREDMTNPINVHASSSTEELSTDAMTFQTPPIREITADQVDAIMKANSVHKVTDGQNGDFQILLSETEIQLFCYLVGARIHRNSVKSTRGREFLQCVNKHFGELLTPKLLSGPRKSDHECEIQKGFPLGVKMVTNFQGAAKNLWVVRIVTWTDRGKRQAIKGPILASRIAKVYEIMCFYHTLAFGPVNCEQTKSTIENLRQWFWDIVFEGTDSSLPLLGLVRLPQMPEDPQSLFGDLQIYLAKTFMNSSTSVYAQLPQVSLALLGYWYKTQGHKFGFPRSESDHFWQRIYKAACVERDEGKYRLWYREI